MLIIRNDINIYYYKNHTVLIKIKIVALILFSEIGLKKYFIHLCSSSVLQVQRAHIPVSFDT